MDAKTINPFINATRSVLETMAFVESIPGKPFLKKDRKAIGDVSGVIGLTGEAEGTIAITFEKATILHIVSSMFGEEITEINRDITDAVGEITNMVSGQGRMELERKGKLIHGAIPSIITGENHTLVQILQSPTIAISFALKGHEGAFTMEISLQDRA